MRRSRLIQKLRDNEPVRICALGHFIPAYVRMAAEYGFDAIWFDGEHRCFSEREVQTMLAYFHAFDIDCMLRAPTLEKTRLYRYLEDGATGLMIPHVSTPEKAKMLADSVRFPPLGDRGLDGASFDSDFYFDDLDDYVAKANEETFLVVQIETPEAVENVDAIAATPGVTGMFVGPGDLGLRLKHLENGPTLDDCFERVAAAAAKHGKAWGCPVGSTEAMQKRRDQGAQLLAHGGDFMALRSMLEGAATTFDSVYGPRK